MTPDQIKAEIIHLRDQHPSPYTPGQWYPATNKAGKAVEIQRTQGKGRNAGRSYLHARVPTTINIKTTTGEIINSHKGYTYYRMDLHNYTIKDEGIGYP